MKDLLHSCGVCLSFLSTKHLETVIHAFISSRTSAAVNLLTHLTENAATRILTGTRKYEHIKPILSFFHFLPFTFRIDFEIVLLTFKALNSLATSYVLDLLTPHVLTVRSSNAPLLKKPQS